MNKRGLLLLSLIIFILLTSNTLALEVTLSNQPENNKEYVFLDPENVLLHFKCKVTGSIIDSVRLYTNISGTWGQTGNTKTNIINNTELDFVVTNIPTGIYEWNCFANAHLFAPQNHVFSVYVEPNQPPLFSGIIPNQEWNKDSSLQNAFDLDGYFTDPDSDVLIYSYTGLSPNLIININSQNQVTFSQIPGWFGDGGTVTFVASDGEFQKNSNLLTLKVNNIIPNAPPQISTTIPDQNKNSDVTSWALDLLTYATDSKDTQSQLKWNISGVNTSLITTTISGSVITFNHVQDKYGSDQVTFTVQDTGGLTASQNIQITISQPLNNTVENEETNETEEIENIEILEITPTIKSNTPADQTQILEEGQDKKFSITPSDDTLRIRWYLDGDRVSVSNTYTFKALEAGEQNLSVIVTDGIESDSKEWKIVVNPKTQLNVTKRIESICGNGKIDPGETCVSCSLDIKCEEGYICAEEKCVEDKTNIFSSITGSVIGVLNPIKLYWYIPLIIIFSLILLILFLRKKKKPKGIIVNTFHKKEPFLKKIQRKLREADQKRQDKKKEISLKKAESKIVQKQMDLIAPSTTQISHFIRESLSKGHKKREIKKALKKRGWNRKQIKLGFKNIT